MKRRKLISTIKELGSEIALNTTSDSNEVLSVAFTALTGNLEDASKVPWEHAEKEELKGIVDILREYYSSASKYVADFGRYKGFQFAKSQNVTEPVEDKCPQHEGCEVEISFNEEKLNMPGVDNVLKSAVILGMDSLSNHNLAVLLQTVQIMMKAEHGN